MQFCKARPKLPMLLAPVPTQKVQRIRKVVLKGLEFFGCIRMTCLVLLSEEHLEFIWLRLSGPIRDRWSRIVWLGASILPNIASLHVAVNHSFVP
eukprot:6209401-Amphidinium_carterae.1